MDHQDLYDKYEIFELDYDLDHDGISWISEDALCVCGDIWCLNISTMTTFESLTHSTEEEKERMHTALKSKDCGHICQLLSSGMHLCCEGEDSCLVNIVKYWKFPFINSVLKLHPSTVGCRGAGGNTVLMLSDTLTKLEVLMKYGPVLNAVNDEGETLLHHAVKYRLNDTAHKMLQLFNDHNGIFDDDFLMSVDVYTLFKESTSMIEFIVKSGVDLDIEDATGKTALQVLLESFKCGYVLRQFHRITGGNGFHYEELCTLDNEIASHALYQLLKANATIPPPDDFGRTALMMAALSPWNMASLMFIIERDVDVTAKDQNGFNAIFYMLSSFAQQYHMGCRHTFLHKSSDIDIMAALLFMWGCEIQGTDIVMFDAEYDDTIEDDRFKLITHLLTLNDSKLNQCDFPEKLALKNDTENYTTFLQLYVHNRSYDEHTENDPWHFEMNDVAIIEKELAQGLNVCHRKQTIIDSTSPGENWSEKLCIPGAISTTVYLQLHIIHLNRDLRALVDGLVPEKNYYLIVDKIQRLFLPFWPHPPISLVLMCYYGNNLQQQTNVILRKRFLEFLFDVGGPLSPGSELYIAVKNTFELAAQKAPLFKEVRDLFHKLHTGIPTLEQLARTALRGSFKFGRTDGVGLDLSSLRIKWQGNMLVLPPLIKNIINFKPLLYKPVKKARGTH